MSMLSLAQSSSCLEQRYLGSLASSRRHKMAICRCSNPMPPIFHSPTRAGPVYSVKAQRASTLRQPTHSETPYLHSVGPPMDHNGTDACDANTRRMPPSPRLSTRSKAGHVPSLPVLTPEVRHLHIRVACLAVILYPHRR